MNYRFSYRARVNAPVDVAWGVFTEHEKFAQWTTIDFAITKAGSVDRNGLGCIRQDRASNSNYGRVEEVVNYWLPNQLYGYHIISGAPFDSHQAIVRFFAKGANHCEWVYDAQFGLSASVLEKMPDAQQNLQKLYTYFMHDTESECERRASDIEVPAFPLPVGNPAGGQV